MVRVDRVSVDGVHRAWRPDWPCPVGSIAVTLRHGGADPTYRTDPDCTIWRGLRTPEGPRFSAGVSTRDGSRTAPCEALRASAA